MTCRICELIRNRESLIYEDDKIAAFLSRKPAIPGHIVLTTKGHYPIFENVPDDAVSHIFTVANKLSTITFETLGAQGTNIIVNNGLAAGQKEPHFLVNIIPRKEGDNLKLEWNPKKPIETELEEIHAKLLGTAKSLDEAPKEEVLDADEKKDDIDDKDYLLDSLIRIP